MGAVYLAEHPRIGKKVAVKILHPKLCADADLVSRFFQEARAANSIGHPNIVDISDFGETEDGTVYLVMEFLVGKTLREVLRAGHVDVQRAIGIARQIADALEAAHKAGIVHRDLKPENVFLLDGAEGAGDRIKLFDFGIAKLMTNWHTPDHKTAPGMVMGTPFYMAPEQMEGREVDARADIYSLGVVLYEMVTGEVPFGGSQLVEIVAAILQSKAPPVASTRAAGVPEWLDRLLVRCLDKDAVKRPSSMSVVISALRNRSLPEARHSSPSAPAFPGDPGEPPAAVPVAGNDLVTADSRRDNSRLVWNPKAPSSLDFADAWTPQTPDATDSGYLPIEAGAPGAPVVRRAPSRQVPAMMSMPAPGPGQVLVPAMFVPAPENWYAPEKMSRRAARRVNHMTMRATTSLASALRRIPPPLKAIGWSAVLLLTAIMIAPQVLPAFYDVRRALKNWHQPAPPPLPPEVVLTIDSTPRGATVTRVRDGKRIGLTPTREVERADGTMVEYLISLAGYTEAVVPFALTHGGDRPVNVTLRPVTVTPPPTQKGALRSVRR